MSNRILMTPSVFATFIRKEMARNKITIKAFAKFAGASQERVREVRNLGKAECQWEWMMTLRDCAKAAL